MLPDLKRLCRRIGYEFNDINLLKQALSHCSVGSINNERLEFLGDSILSFVIANQLFKNFPGESEGQLSRLRSHLVKGDMLAELALELSLGDYLFLGQGELKSGGFRRASTLADALEALFAAIFLDGGLPAAERVILNIFQSRLQDHRLNENLKDAKTQLQEYLQANKLPLPQYTLRCIEGEEHDQIFHVTCDVICLKQTTEGKGANRRKAEQHAAKQLLDQLLKHMPD